MAIGNLLQASGMSHLRNAFYGMGYPAQGSRRRTRRRRPVPIKEQNTVQTNTTADHQTELGTNTEVLTATVEEGNEIRRSDNTQDDLTWPEHDRPEHKAIDAVLSGSPKPDRITNDLLSNGSVEHGREVRDHLEEWKYNVMQDTDLYISRRDEATNLVTFNDQERLRQINGYTVIGHNLSERDDGMNSWKLLNEWREMNSTMATDQLEGFATNASQNSTNEGITNAHSDELIPLTWRQPQMTGASDTLDHSEASRDVKVLNFTKREEAGTMLANGTEYSAVEIETARENNEPVVVSATHISQLGQISEPEPPYSNSPIASHTNVLHSQAAYDFKINTHATRTKSTDLVFPSGVPLADLLKHVQEVVHLYLGEKSQQINQETGAAEMPQQMGESLDGGSNSTLSNSTHDSKLNETNESELSPEGYRQDERQFPLPILPQTQPLLHGDHQNSSELTNQTLYSVSNFTESSYNINMHEHIKKIQEHVNNSYDSVADQLKPKWDIGLPKVEDLKEMPDLPLPANIPLGEQIGFMEEEDRNKLAFTTLNNVEDHFKIVDQKAASYLQRLDKERDGLIAQHQAKHEDGNSADETNIETDLSATKKEDSKVDDGYDNNNKFDEQGEVDVVSGTNHDNSVYHGKDEATIKFTSSLGVVPLETLKEEVRINQKQVIEPTDEKLHQSQHGTSKSRVGGVLIIILSVFPSELAVIGSPVVSSLIEKDRYATKGNIE